MEIDRNRGGRVVNIADYRRVGLGEDKVDPRNLSLDPAQRPLAQEDVERAQRLNSEKPRYGGLHRLAIADFEKAELSAEPDFARYRVGFNNRDLLGAIVRDLNTRFGVNIHYGYSSALEAFGRDSRDSGTGFRGSRVDGFHIGEKVIDSLVEPFESAVDRRAVATFAVAHEFFHSLLRHPDVDAGPKSRPNGWRIKSYDKYRALMEIQVDYLAARYLRLLGLPLEPVMEMFNKPGQFEGGKDYPDGATRALSMATAKEPEFRLDLFSNEIVDCLDFLETLV